MFRYPVVLALDNIRSVQNVASLFRIADCVGIHKVILGGITPLPVDRFGRKRTDFAKISLGSEDVVSWEHASRLLVRLKKYRALGYDVVCVEQTSRSQVYTSYVLKKPTIIVLGNEVEGVSSSICTYADTCVEIPMSGAKESLNVAVTGAIVAFRLRDGS